MICILGMHRSGTSCVAGTLQAAGLHLGDVFTVNRHNLKGNREHPDILALHNDLLEDNQGLWSDPPPMVRWSRDHRLRRDAIIADLSSEAPCWGFKDPRTLFTLDGWLEVVPHPTFVGVLRHPRAVARSMESRSGMPAAHALRLWHQHNSRLADYRARFAMPIVCFDMAAAELIAALRTLCRQLDLDPAVAATFFEADLRHHDGARESWDEVPDAVRALYEDLTAQAL